MKYIIEQTDIASLANIAQLNQEIFRGMYEDEPYALPIFQAKLAGKEPLILVAKDDEQLIGYSISFLRDNALYIWLLGVGAPYRNQGIASALLDGNQSYAQRHNISAITIKTYNVSPEMLRLLIKQGYHITDVQKSSKSSIYTSIFLRLEV